MRLLTQLREKIEACRTDGGWHRVDNKEEINAALATFDEFTARIEKYPAFHYYGEEYVLKRDILNMEDER